MNAAELMQEAFALIDKGGEIIKRGVERQCEAIKADLKEKSMFGLVNASELRSKKFKSGDIKQLTPVWMKERGKQLYDRLEAQDYINSNKRKRNN